MFFMREYDRVIVFKEYNAIQTHFWPMKFVFYDNQVLLATIKRLNI